MKAGALAWNVLGMSVFGLAALVGFALLVAHRAGDEQAAAALGPGPRTARAPMATLAGGASHQAWIAAEGLSGGAPASRTIAALDAAHRAARVAAESAPPGIESADLASAALHHIEEARHAVEVGAPARAGRLVSAAAAELRRAADRAGTVIPRRPDALDRYPGTALIDVRGRRVGELLAVDGRGARCRLGGLSDVFGVFDLGGRTVTVPLDRLVFGRAHRLRRAAVVLLPAARPVRAAAGVSARRRVSPRSALTAPASSARARGAVPGA